MQKFIHDGFEIGFLDEGSGEPVLLIHGFASTAKVNWVSPGWVKTLTENGYRVFALDNRGHGISTKSHHRKDYKPSLMARDAVGLLDHLDVTKAHVMGYSMGARIAAFLALEFPERVNSLIFGGLGDGMIKGVGAWDLIADALLAEDPETITDARGRAFRKFADQTKSDRVALAACISTSRELLSPDQIQKIRQPALVAVGTKDDIAGAPGPLAELLPRGTAFPIQDRDHMLAVGDPSFKRRVIEFLAMNPI